MQVLLISLMLLVLIYKHMLNILIIIELLVMNMTIIIYRVSGIYRQIFHG